MSGLKLTLSPLTSFLLENLSGIKNIYIYIQASLKVHLCRFENLPISSLSPEKYVEDFALKYLLLYEICASEICKKFVYKNSETIEYVKN